MAPGGGPQAAVVGFAVSDLLEIVFDTVTTSRKYQNLRRDPRIVPPGGPMPPGGYFALPAQHLRFV